MHSLKDKFEELRHRLGRGRSMDSTGTEPIFYLVFPVADLLEVKRQTKHGLRNLLMTVGPLSHFPWPTQSRLSWVRTSFAKYGWKSEREILVEAEQRGVPLDFRQINKTLAAALVEGQELQELH